MQKIFETFFQSKIRFTQQPFEIVMKDGYKTFSQRELTVTTTRVVEEQARERERVCEL